MVLSATMNVSFITANARDKIRLLGSQSSLPNPNDKEPLYNLESDLGEVDFVV